MRQQIFVFLPLHSEIYLAPHTQARAPSGRNATGRDGLFVSTTARREFKTQGIIAHTSRGPPSELPRKASPGIFTGRNVQPGKCPHHCMLLGKSHELKQSCIQTLALAGLQPALSAPRLQDYAQCCAAFSKSSSDQYAINPLVRFWEEKKSHQCYLVPDVESSQSAPGIHL